MPFLTSSPSCTNPRISRVPFGGHILKITKGGHMKKITFFENKELNHILNEMETLSTTEEKEAYLKIQLKELANLPESRKKEIQAAARKGMVSTLELASHVKVMYDLQRLGNIISFAYIANEYFKKSKSWIHQRLNGYIVNNKPACFNTGEISTLATALEEIAGEIQNVAKDLKKTIASEKEGMIKLKKGKEES